MFKDGAESLGALEHIQDKDIDSLKWAGYTLSGRYAGSWQSTRKSWKHGVTL